MSTTTEITPSDMLSESMTLQAAMRAGKACVMLWSQSQCAIHIEPVETMLSSNRRAYAEDRGMDYVPLFIGTDRDCRSVADALRGTMSARQDARQLDGSSGMEALPA